MLCPLMTIPDVAVRRARCSGCSGRKEPLQVAVVQPGSPKTRARVGAVEVDVAPSNDPDIRRSCRTCQTVDLER